MFVGEEPSLTAADEMLLHRLSSKLTKLNAARLHQRQQQSITSYFLARSSSYSGLSSLIRDLIDGRMTLETVPTIECTLMTQIQAETATF